MSEEATLVFEGIDGRECETFIRAVKSRAFAVGKQRDYEWMADFASTCFEGNGLRWFSGLDDETQGNWKLLERALLRDFPSAANASQPPSSAIPTVPAAAPPPPPTATPSDRFDGQAPAQSPNYPPAAPPLAGPNFSSPFTSLRKGRLRLTFDADTATHTVYIKKTPDSFGYCTTTSSINEAVCIVYKPSEGRVELVVINGSDPTRREVFGAIRVGDRRLQRANLVVGSDIASGDSEIWLVKAGRTVSFLPRLQGVDGATLRVYNRDKRPIITWAPAGSDTSPARLEFEPVT